ncbi:MAG: phospho-N-acetylmuramoyl-pentapeptide-transferase [Oscillospiraceae bacterium]|nr:phospho-N-acetylmuramoyl-pentapeptide-transferase [Oscillospiraceae bacterium]
MRIIAACIVSFVLTWLLGKVVIPFLHALKAGQTIKEIGPKWHMAKQGTPTMGGIMFIFGTLIAVLVLGWADFMAGNFGALIVFGFAFIYGVIGFIDDYFKVRFHKNEGLTAAQKFLLQLAASILCILLLRNSGYLASELYVPFVNVTIQVPWIFYMVFAAFVMTGTDNAVNITDGVDGLATGVTMPVMAFYLATSVLWGKTELGILSAAMLGGLAGFLIYNFHPAKVFMGDTGSLFLGGMVCGLAFALNMPIVLILVGIIYICETLSVIIQVTYFKATHGKRIFRMAPIHHHFEMGGWSEYKLFTVFTGVTAVMCVLAYLGVLSR